MRAACVDAKCKSFGRCLHHAGFAVSGIVGYCIGQAMMPATPERFALGIDAGGTHTRWALLSREGTPIGTGYAAGLSRMQMHTGTGRATDTLSLRN